MATMVEFVQRMLTNRPTVALTAERPIWLDARSPTRARDPRTEITRPKDVTVLEPGMSLIVFQSNTMHAVVGETVKPGASNRRRFVGARSIRSPWLALAFSFVRKSLLLRPLIAAMSRPA